jgi:hypothetical protein
LFSSFSSPSSAIADIREVSRLAGPTDIINDQLKELERDSDSHTNCGILQKLFLIPDFQRMLLYVRYQGIF